MFLQHRMGEVVHQTKLPQVVEALCHEWLSQKQSFQECELEGKV